MLEAENVSVNPNVDQKEKQKRQLSTSGDPAFSYGNNIVWLFCTSYAIVLNKALYVKQ